MLAGRDVEARGLGVVDHHAIGAAVDPALVGIAGDVEAAGADVAAAVGGVPFRRGKAGDVDVVAGHDVLEDRTVVDVFGRDARHRSHEAGAEAFAELELAEVGGKAERHVLALAAEEVDQHAAAIDRVRHLVEDEAGRAVVVHRDAGHHADVLLPVEPADILDLAEPARLLEPLPQIVIDQPRLRIGAAPPSAAAPLGSPAMRLPAMRLFLESGCVATKPPGRGPAAQCCARDAIPRASLHTGPAARIPQVARSAAHHCRAQAGRMTRVPALISRDPRAGHLTIRSARAALEQTWRRLHLRRERSQTAPRYLVGRRRAASAGAAGPGVRRSWA